MAGERLGSRVQHLLLRGFCTQWLRASICISDQGIVCAAGKTDTPRQ